MKNPMAEIMPSDFLNLYIWVLTMEQKHGILTVLVQVIQFERRRSMINLDYKSGKSIHEQIYDNIKALIVKGALKEDDKLPSVREMSISLTVNPNTVQKAYKELENDGYIYSVKAKGNFVAKIEKADREKTERLLQDLRRTLSELKFSGVEEDEIISTVKEIYKEEKHD